MAKRAWLAAFPRLRAGGHGLLHFALDLLAQFVELVGGEAHGVLVAADDFLGGILHGAAQLGDVLGQLTLNVTGSVGEVVAHPVRQFVERRFQRQVLVRDVVVDPDGLLPGAAHAVLQFLRKQFFRRLGLAGNLLHLLQQFLELLLLRLGHVDRLLEFALIAEGAEGCLPVRVDRLVQFALVVVQFARVLTHLAHGLGELARGLIPVILADLVEVSAGTRSGVGSLRKLFALEVAGSLLHLLAGLLELPARLGQLVVLAALHPLLNLIEIIDQFALFLLQALEFALDAFALGLVLGVEQGDLQFLHPLIQVRLPPGQFLEAVERL